MTTGTARLPHYPSSHRNSELQIRFTDRFALQRSNLIDWAGLGVCCGKGQRRLVTVTVDSVRCHRELIQPPY